MLSRLVSRLPILLLLQSWTDDLKKSHWKPTLVPITGLLSSFSQEPGRSPAQQRSKHSVLASKEFLYSRSCAVVFVSTDSHSQFTLKAWNNSGELEGGLGGVYIPLVSDSSHSISRDYGVLIEEQGAAERALFIIDPKGVIRNITVSDADVGRSVDETQRVIDALAFKDEYGEGCPVNWKKGDQGLEYSAQTRVEGPIEVSTIHKKSWSDWARPKLQRAWSNNSQRSSIGSTSLNASLINFPTMPHAQLVAKRNHEVAMQNMSLGVGVAN